MSRSLLVRLEAEQDLAEAFGWYEEQRPGLGSDFLLCVEAALTQICRNPRAFPIVHRSVHRALLPRFPYGVFFVLERERVVVLAVLHAKRNPRRWPRRR